MAELRSALQRPAANVGIWRRKLKSGRSCDALGKIFNEVEVFRGSRRLKQLFKKSSFTLIFKCAKAANIRVKMLTRLSDVIPLASTGGDGESVSPSVCSPQTSSRKIHRLYV